jgi:hypothetical protein
MRLEAVGTVTDLDIAPVNRRRTQAIMAAVGLAVAVAAGSFFAAVHTSHLSPGAPGAVAATLRTCGAMPTSTSPLASSVVLTLSAPAAARSGTTINAVAVLRAIGATVTVPDAGLPVLVDVVQGSAVVGTYTGAIGGTGLAAAIDSRGQELPTAPLLLSGCPSGRIDYAHPDASRRPLPAGSYQLVAVLDISQLAGPSEEVTSAPISIHLTD